MGSADSAVAKVAKPRFVCGQKVRITDGAARGTVGEVVAEHVPLRPRAWRVWVLRASEFPFRHEIREDFLEPAP